MMSNDYRQTLLKGGTSLDAHRKSLAFHTQTKQGRTIKIDNQTYDIDKLILASLGGKNHRAAQFAKPVLFSSKYLEFLQHCTDYMRLYVREKLAVAFERSTKQGTDVPSVLAHLMSELCKSPSQAPDTISLAEINKQVIYSVTVEIVTQVLALYNIPFLVIHELERLFRTSMFQPLTGTLFKDPLQLLMFRYLKNLENPVVTKKPGEDDNIWADFKTRLQKASDMVPQQHAWIDQEKSDPTPELNNKSISFNPLPSRPITSHSVKSGKSQFSVPLQSNYNRKATYTPSTAISTAYEPSTMNTEKLQVVSQMRNATKPYLLLT